jgi:hypothetical protein
MLIARRIRGFASTIVRIAGVVGATRHRAAVFLVLLASSALLAGCGGRAYLYEPVESVDFRSHSETQSEGPVRVSTAVLGREETEKIFGLSLYDQGIQPVWLEVENRSADQVRYAPVGTDRFYFSPQEVAYKNRGGFSDEARTEMERRFDRLSMPRYIGAGETRAGFIFTHADLGAKGFNVDLFGSSDLIQFTFLMRVPGFVPDYANVDFDSIYESTDIRVYVGVDLYEATKSLACCSADENGAEVGDPLNVVLVGAGKDLLRAVLRSGWVETSVQEATDQSSHFLYGRSQDAIFRYHSMFGDSFYELRLWLAPMTAGEDRVWAGQVRHFFNSSSATNRLDPDVDNARNFVFQNLVYGQTLKSVGWIAGQEVAPAESFWTNLIKPAYFSDGYRVVLWLSGDPVSILDAKPLDWDSPPAWRR